MPVIHPVLDLAAWLKRRAASEHADWLRCVLSLAADTELLHTAMATIGPAREVLILSGPEGGLSSAEDGQVRQAGFAPIGLGARVLRSETAALAALVICTSTGPL